MKNGDHKNLDEDVYVASFLEIIPRTIDDMKIRDFLFITHYF